MHAQVNAMAPGSRPVTIDEPGWDASICLAVTGPEECRRLIHPNRSFSSRGRLPPPHRWGARVSPHKLHSARARTQNLTPTPVTPLKADHGATDKPLACPLTLANRGLLRGRCTILPNCVYYIVYRIRLTQDACKDLSHLLCRTWPATRLLPLGPTSALIGCSQYDPRYRVILPRSVIPQFSAGCRLSRVWQNEVDTQLHGACLEQ